MFGKKVGAEKKSSGNADKTNNPGLLFLTGFTSEVVFVGAIKTNLRGSRGIAKECFCHDCVRACVRFAGCFASVATTMRRLRESDGRGATSGKEVCVEGDREAAVPRSRAIASERENIGMKGDR